MGRSRRRQNKLEMAIESMIPRFTLGGLWGMQKTDFNGRSAGGSIEAVWFEPGVTGRQLNFFAEVSGRFRPFRANHFRCQVLQIEGFFLSNLIQTGFSQQPHICPVRQARCTMLRLRRRLPRHFSAALRTAGRTRRRVVLGRSDRPWRCAPPTQSPHREKAVPTR